VIEGRFFVTCDLEKDAETEEPGFEIDEGLGELADGDINE
jgi:hypothetical protein